MLREMMLFHASTESDPGERVSQARALADFIDEGGRASILAGEMERVRNCADWYLIHDDLAEVNDAFWFHEFAEQAADCGLQFLAEADFFNSDYQSFPESVRSTLDGMAQEDIRLKEQYLDFLTCRRFRQTLLCREEAHVDRNIAPERVRGLWTASQAVPLSGEAEALEKMARRWPEYIPVNDCGLAPEMVAALFSSGVIELHTGPAPFTAVVSEHPCASAFARFQAAQGNVVTSLRHLSVDLQSGEAARLLRLLDGSLSRDEVNAEPAVLHRFAELALLEQ
jgi:hypothetical protein